MPASTNTTEVTSSWSEDLAAGATSMLIQLKTARSVLIHIGASAPAAGSTNGITLAGDDAELSLGAPAFQAGDKVYARAPEGDASIVVVKS